MDNASFTTKLVRAINVLLVLLGMGLIILWIADVYSLTDLARITDQVKESVAEVWIARIVFGLLALVIILLNLGYVFSSPSSSRYATHLRSEIEDGEASVSIEAIENTLERAIRDLAEIHDVNVDVLKEKGEEEEEIRVRTSIVTLEKNKFKDVIEHVRRMLKDRWEQIIEPDEQPYYEIVLGGVAVDSGETEQQEEEQQEEPSDMEEDEDPYLSEKFSGPKYPVDEEDESS